jgi:hypothetical protein
MKVTAHPFQANKRDWGLQYQKNPISREWEVLNPKNRLCGVQEMILKLEAMQDLLMMTQRKREIAVSE